MKLTSLVSKALYKSHSSYAVPLQLGVCITPYCNLSCSYCMRSSFRPKGAPWTLETLISLLKRMPSIQGVCFMGLCEPFTNPAIYRMLPWLEGHGYSTAVTTNGTIPFKDFAALSCAGELMFSIDTIDPKIFAEVRGGASIDAVLANLESVIEWKHKNNSQKPPVRINGVISEKTIAQLPAMFDYFDAYANDIDFIQFDVVSRPDYSPSDPVCLKHSKEFAAKLGALSIEAAKHKIKVLNCTQVNSNNLERGKPMSFMLEEATNWRSCPLSWYSMFVEPNGDAYFCYNYGYVLGNVFTESPLKVWNSAKARTFRKMLQTKEPPVKQCKICNFARLGNSR